MLKIPFKSLVFENDIVVVEMQYYQKIYFYNYASRLYYVLFALLCVSDDDA